MLNLSVAETGVAEMAPKFIKIGELQRRQMRAKQEAEDEMAARQASDLKAAAEKTAKAEAKRIAAKVAEIEAATAAAVSKKVTFMNRLPMLRGTWASRAKEQLEQDDGVLEAVKKLQRAVRSWVSSACGGARVW